MDEGQNLRNEKYRQADDVGGFEGTSESSPNDERIWDLGVYLLGSVHCISRMGHESPWHRRGRGRDVRLRAHGFGDLLIANRYGAVAKGLKLDGFGVEMPIAFD